jgi:RHS repeat-associated protein
MFVYVGWNLRVELTEANAVTHSYFWGLDLSGSEQGGGGVGGLLFIKPLTGGPLSSTYDGNGSVSGSVDLPTGSLNTEEAYGPFGEALQSPGRTAGANAFGFSTKYHDDEGNLLYYGQRYYSESTGKWASRDPIGEEGGLNVTAFVENDSVNAFDPTGLAVYVVYREFDIDSLGDALRRAYSTDSLFTVGHFYLAFDDENTDRKRWECLVKTLGPQTHPIPREADPTLETFSFHPWKVLLQQLKEEGSPPPTPTLQDRLNPESEGSFVGYNDEIDKRWFWLSGRNKYRIHVSATQQEQLYRAVIASRNLNNLSAMSGDIGSYNLTRNNCGTWARVMLESQLLRFPRVGLRGNAGVGIGGVGDHLRFRVQYTQPSEIGVVISFPFGGWTPPGKPGNGP